MSLYSELSDNDLFLLLKKEDQRAFAEIYERYHSILLNYTFKKINNPLEAADIVQDVLIKIWNKRHDLVLRSSLTSYLFRAIRNRILDLFAHQEVEEKYLHTLQYLINHATPSDYLIREKEIQKAIDHEISLMPERMRLIFQLSRNRNMSNAEIANELELSVHTVDTQIKRALRQLKAKLGQFTHLFFTLFL